LTSELFRGIFDQDWADAITAPINNLNINIKYDKVTRIASGNDSGVQNVYNRWHPMNANLRYAEEEAGGLQGNSQISTRSKIGMGDYYVIDFFKPHPAATASDGMQFSPQATLYWHEK